MDMAFKKEMLRSSLSQFYFLFMHISFLFYRFNECFHAMHVNLMRLTITTRESDSYFDIQFN
jgi:hypothetical protein